MPEPLAPGGRWSYPVTAHDPHALHLAIARGFSQLLGRRVVSICGAMFAFACALPIGACSGSESTPDAAVDPSDGAQVSCRNDARVDSFVGDLTKKGQTLSFHLMSDVAPHRGDNAFRLTIANPSGQPMGGDLSVDLKMPDHGHGSPAPTVVHDDATGTYVVGPASFFMPGVWRVEFDLSSSGASVDSAVFYFCVEG